MKVKVERFEVLTVVVMKNTALWENQPTFQRFFDIQENDSCEHYCGLLKKQSDIHVISSFLSVFLDCS
jgi:hypothetical protein